MKKGEKLIAEIITRYGATIDLRKNPNLIIEIYKRFGKTFDEIPDGGTPCGGVPLPPPPAPGPNQLGIRNIDVVRQANTLIDQLAQMQKNVNAVLKLTRNSK